MGSSGINAASAKNPKIAGYMQDKDLMQKMNMIMSMGKGNQQMQQQLLMQMMNQDPRVLEVFMAMQGIDVSTMSPEDLGGDRDPSQPSRAPPPAKKEEPKKEEEPD